MPALLARGFAAHRGAIAARVGLFYRVNTAGAAAGALVAIRVLIPRFGMGGTIHVAVLLNALCGLMAIPLAWRVAPEAAETAAASVEVEGEPTRQRHGHSGWRAWALLFGVSGFFALSYELLWFRLLNVMLKSSAFVFGTLIGVYLVGLGGGAALGSLLVRGARRPQRAFLSLQALALIYGGLAPALLIHQIDAPAFRRLGVLFAAYEALRRASGAQRSPAAHCRPEHCRDASGSGRFHPSLCRAAFTTDRHSDVLVGASSRSSSMSFRQMSGAWDELTGHLLAANIAGSTCGAFVTGWFLLDWFGTAGTLRMLVGGGVAFAAMATGGSRMRPDGWWRWR